MTFNELEEIHQQYLTKHNHIAKKLFSIPVIILIINTIIFIINLIKIETFSVDTFLTALGSAMPLLFVSLITFIITASIVDYKTRNELSAYKKAYKAYFVGENFQKIFQNVNYHHEQGIPRQTVAAVMYGGDRYYSNDLTIASYKGLNFTQADVHTEEQRETTDKNGNTTTYYVTIFKGRFMIFDFNRNFNYNMQLSSKNFPGERLPYSPNSNRKFEQLKTESSDFNKNFTIYAQDGVDALYILEPAFMEKIQKLYTDCGHEIMLTFMNKKIYFAINDGKDSFEVPNPQKPLDEKTESAKVKKDIQVITNFVDELCLNRYIFKSHE